MRLEKIISWLVESGEGPLVFLVVIILIAFLISLF